jgi:tol-pal system-associated acyl-CoA thioesterase
VYHARYLEWAERARAAMLRTLGLSNAVLQQQGIVFAVHTLTVRYHRPARLDDILTISTILTAAQGARLHVKHHINKNDEILVSIELMLACTALSGKPRRLPPELLAALPT